MTLIKAWIFDPNYALFKSGRNEKAQMTAIYCDNYENCDAFKAGCCVSIDPFNRCSHGRINRQTGYTRKARAFKQWIDEKKEFIKSQIAPNLKSPRDRIYRIGDRYYFPYSFMDGAEFDTSSKDKPFSRELVISNKWVDAKDVTADLLNKICLAIPRTVFESAEIKDYQQKIVPKFVNDLHEHYPDLFELLTPENKARINDINHIGRKAILQTLNSSKVKTISGLWDWDYDTQTLSKPSSALDGFTGTLTATMTEDFEIAVTDNSQVRDDTKFMD